MAKSARFKYVGDPNDRLGGPDVVEMGGVRFAKGEAVTVPEDAKYGSDGTSLIDRLQGHSHFVDLSDKDTNDHVAQMQKDMEAQAKEREKREEAQRKQDEKDEEMRERNAARAAERGGLTAANAPRPPGTVTRPPPGDPFQGRTVEERTAAEDHTKAGKTKS